MGNLKNTRSSTSDQLSQMLNDIKRVKTLNLQKKICMLTENNFELSAYVQQMCGREQRK